jgi:hypothetical protein
MSDETLQFASFVVAQASINSAAHALIQVLHSLVHLSRNKTETSNQHLLMMEFVDLT